VKAGGKPSNTRLTFNRLHGVISQKIVLFITTAARTSFLQNIYVFSVLVNSAVLIVNQQGKSKLGFEVFTVVTMRGIVLRVVMPCSSESLTFHKNISPPSSGSRNKPLTEAGGKLGSASHLLLQVSCMTYSLVLEMEVVCHCEASVNFCWPV
jgi:hypothetical protein